MRQSQDMMDKEIGAKKDVGPKPSLADRLRQLADGTLPLMDERMDRDMRSSRGDRGGSDRHERSSTFDETSVRQQPPLPPAQPSTPQQQPQQPQQPQPPPSLLQSGRRPGDGPPSLLDLPAQFPGDRSDFGGPRDFGPRPDGRDLRDFPQRGPGKFTALRTL